MENHINQRLALGLDSSTQSLSEIVINIDTAEKCFEHTIDYRADTRTNCFGIGEDYILPPKSEGEAEQPPLMYLASLDAMFVDMREAGVALENIVVINTSGQQHGHVYLNRNAAIIFSNMQRGRKQHIRIKNTFSRYLLVLHCTNMDDCQYRCADKPCPRSSRWKNRDD